MNAGGVPNTCKSDVSARMHGRRVSNAWGIYLFVGNNVPKGMVILHVIHDWDVVDESRGPVTAWRKKRILRLIS